MQRCSCPLQRGGSDFWCQPAIEVDLYTSSSGILALSSVFAFTMTSPAARSGRCHVVHHTFGRVLAMSVPSCVAQKLARLGNTYLERFPRKPLERLLAWLILHEQDEQAWRIMLDAHGLSDDFSPRFDWLRNTVCLGLQSLSDAELLHLARSPYTMLQLRAQFDRHPETADGQWQRISGITEKAAYRPHPQQAAPACPGGT